jgi:ABC-type transport system substrate-binding protein
MNDLIVRGTQTVVVEERQAIYNQIQELFVEDVPMLFHQFDQNITPFNARVKGLPVDPVLNDQVFYSAHRYWIDES